MNKLREIFSNEPNTEQVKHFKAELLRAATEKWCGSCKHVIPPEADTPGCCSACLLCKFGGIADKVCSKYELDAEKLETIEKICKEKEART